MSTRMGAAPLVEPSVEAIRVMRERLREMGFLVTDDAARALLGAVLGVEGARLEPRVREALAACLRGIQEAASEALRILAAEPASAVPSPPPPPSSQAASGSLPRAPVPPTVRLPAFGAEGRLSPRRDEPVSLTDIVRQRLGDDVPVEERGPRGPRGPDEPFFEVEPRRPVFKRPRGR